MKSWRIFLAMAVLAISYLGLYCLVLFIKFPEVQVLIFFIALTVGMGALSLAQDDGRNRKEK